MILFFIPELTLLTDNAWRVIKTLKSDIKSLTSSEYRAIYVSPNNNEGKIMSIKDRNLTVGTKLVARYHKESHTCEVIEGQNGKLRYKLENGREFKSPSAAGMAITGHACDGWVFWSVETEDSTPETTEIVPTSEASQTIAEEQKETPVTPATGAEQGPAKKSFFRTPNQKGVTEGQTRWYCQACGESFLAPYGEIPSACPQGHKA